MNKKQIIRIICLLIVLLALSWLKDISLPSLIADLKNILHINTDQKTATNNELPAEAFTNPPSLSDELIKLKKVPYDEELYQLTYQTFIYNSRINDAYNLALIAVAKKPDDLAWHEKLAKTAIWAGDYNTGMKEWLYVGLHTKDLDLIKNGASIAKLLGYDEVTVQLLKLYIQSKPDSIAETIDLAIAENRINMPKQAISTLKHLNETHPTRAAFELIASIYQDLDEWDNALNTWKEADKQFGPDIKSVMAQAQIYYSRQQFTQALDSLKQGVSVAKNTDTDFWQTMAELAWRTGNKSLSVLGLTHLLKDSSSLINLTALERLSNPAQAMHYSLIGWTRYHDLLFFSNAVQFADQLKDWGTLNTLLKELTPEQLLKMQNILAFWEVQANMYEALKDDSELINLLIQGIQSHPEFLELRARLLFLIITKGELQWVKALMQDGYEKNMWNDRVLWKIYADAFDLLNKFYAAIIMYQQHLPQNIHYDQFLIDYGHLLEKIKRNQQANNLWGFLWQRTLTRLKHETGFNKQIYQTLGQIAPHFVSGTIQVQLLTALFVTELSNEDVVILLNWMVPRNYFELISYFKAFYLNNALPAWAGTNLALAHNDLPTLQKSLKNPKKSWSRSDLINAAVRLENTPLAVELAFDELTDRPLAHEIYSEFIQYAIANTNSISVAEEYEKFVNIIGPRTKMDSKFRLTNSWKFQPSFSIWHPKSTDSNTITNVPTSDLQLHAKFDQKIHRGNVTYSLGYRDDLNVFIPASVELGYQIAPQWTAKLKLGFNQENFQNAQMREGGIQDQLNIGVTDTITKYDSLQLEWQGLNYYSQDRHYLANGYIIEGLYEHKFWLSYPDYTIGLFGNIYHFNRNGSYGGDVTTLFPKLPPALQTDPTLVASANEANYQALIPNNYNEGGFTFSFGNTILEYSHNWRPYLWAALYYNSITALSNDIKIGLSGSIFGKDSLIMYAERGTAQSSQNQTNYMLAMRYMLYY